MVKAAKNWAEISNGSSIALFLYSGHGIGEGWNSLLVPVDATTRVSLFFGTPPKSLLVDAEPSSK